MERHPGSALSGFDARWLVEAVRLSESTRPFHDELIVARLAAESGDLEHKLIARAVLLDADESLRREMRQHKQRETLALAVLGLIALISGYGVAVTVLGDSGQAVNIVWTLGGLLGLHVVTLLLWGGLMMLSQAGRGGIGGRLWEWGVQRLATDHHARMLLLARWRLDMRAGAQRWSLSAISHLGWMALLCGMLIGLLLSFFGRHYGFVWETTLLSESVFEHWVGILGWLPSLLGFPVPDAELVRNTGQGMLTDAQAGRVWALWLLGCVLVYGMLPRALCWFWCFWKAGQLRAQLRLYPDDALYAPLAESLMRQSERMGVSDAAPEVIETAHLASAHQASGQSLMLGVELDAGRFKWPPLQADGVGDAGVIDSREQRKRALQMLAASKPHRLLVVCDPCLSPDRGTLSLIADLSVHAGECAVWLLGGDDQQESERLQHWRDVLTTLGLDQEQVFLSAPDAQSWVETQ